MRAGIKTIRIPDDDLRKIFFVLNSNSSTKLIFHASVLYLL